MVHDVDTVVLDKEEKAKCSMVTAPSPPPTSSRNETKPESNVKSESSTVCTPVTFLLLYFYMISSWDKLTVKVVIFTLVNLFAFNQFRAMTLGFFSLTILDFCFLDAHVYSVYSHVFIFRAK